MSKAILVLDKMPGECCQCIFCEKERNRENYLEKRCSLSGLCISKYTIKKSDCPLKEVPKIKETNWAAEDYEFGYDAGWNACLEKILGE